MSEGYREHKMENSVGRVISLKKKRKYDFGTVKYPVILTALSVLGIVCGVLLLKYVDSTGLESLVTALTRFNTDNTQKSFASVFGSALVSNAAYSAGLLLAGLCLAGAPFIFAAPFLKGLGTGLISAYMYSKYAIDGLEYCVLMIYPPAVLMLVSIIIAGTESLYTANELHRIIYSDSALSGKFSLKLYLTRYIIPVALCLASSVIGAATAKMFSDLFKL